METKYVIFPLLLLNVLLGRVSSETNDDDKSRHGSYAEVLEKLAEVMKKSNLPDPGSLWNREAYAQRMIEDYNERKAAYDAKKRQLEERHFLEQINLRTGNTSGDGIDSVDASLMAYQRRPRTPPNDETVKALPCTPRFDYSYVPPGETVRFKSNNWDYVGSNGDHRYPANRACGWYFWTESIYGLEVKCRKMKIKDGDIFTVHNEETGESSSYTNLNKGRADEETMLDLGDQTSEMTAWFITDDQDEDKGFNCEINTIGRPTNPTCQCGVMPSTRVVDGIVSVASPWTVGLMQSETSTSYVCGGTLITSSWILSTAFCTVLNGVTHVALGSTDSTSDSRTVRAVLEWLRHPDLIINSYSLKHNVGLLRIDPIIFTQTIAPACLPPVSDGDFEGEMGIFTGWGSNVGGTLIGSVNELHETQAIIQNPARCRLVLTGNAWNEALEDPVLCSYYDPISSFGCLNDVGGPLVVDNATGRYEVIGLLTTAEKCRTGLNYPDFYEPVTSYLTWIHSVIPGFDLCTA